jgi:addiction module HigA family antidote
VREETPVTTDTALRLARYFGSSPEFWMNLQTSFDLSREAAEKVKEINAIAPRAA